MNTMKMSTGFIASLSFAFVALFYWVEAFNVPIVPMLGKQNHVALHMSSQQPSDPNEFYKMASDQMKNLKPEDLDKMLDEMDNMNPIQKTALKAMGMDPDMMKKSLEMMKKNPAMMESAQRMMANMTPEQLMERSKQAQEQLSKLSAADLDQASKVMENLPPETLSQAAEEVETRIAAAASATTNGAFDVKIEEDKGNKEDEKQMYTGPGSSADPAVIDAMYRVAAFMSDPFDQGGVTLAGFSSLPVIKLLSGDREFDLSPTELRECWSEGAGNAFRVDRAGFELVWNEVQEYFEDDIMSEARKEAKKSAAGQKKQRPSATKDISSTKTVGSSMSADEIRAVNEGVKSMSDSELTSVLDYMDNMDAAAEERMKSMGVDPAMIRKTAQMMKSDPAMMKQAKEIMANTSPEDMLKISRQAQEQMSKMTPEEIKQALRMMQQP